MRQFFRAALYVTTVSLVTGASSAYADGASTLSALKANLARAHVGAPFDMNNVEASATIVKGIYALQDRGSNAFRLFTNEAGTIIGTGAGWQRVAQPNTLSSYENAEIRAELLANIDTDKLIKIQYGDGGGRRMVLFSAVDCGHCFKVEQTLTKLAPSLNTTFYVFPLSLQDDTDQRGQQNWQTAANIWCDQNNSAAWRTYWAKPGPVTGQRCGMTAHQAFVAYYYSQGLFRSVGIQIRGTPQILAEDGKVFYLPDAFDKKYVAENFGQAALGSMNFGSTSSTHHWF